MVPKYKTDVNSTFKCQVQTLDYKKNVKQSKKIINDWVKRCTSGKIKDLFSDIDPKTTCVLVSCIYFKGDWYDKFESWNTYDDSFYCTEEQTSTVKMMAQENHYFYRSFDDSGFKCVKIPYKLQRF